MCQLSPVFNSKTKFYIKQVCWYKMNCWSLLPGIIVTPENKGFRVAIKFLRRHAGIWISWE